MVFNEWFKCLLVMYIITSNNKQTNLASWIVTLKENLLQENDNWLSNMFIVNDAKA